MNLGIAVLVQSGLEQGNFANGPETRKLTKWRHIFLAAHKWHTCSERKKRMELVKCIVYIRDEVKRKATSARTHIMYSIIAR